jgi:hypothetical protein
VTKNESGFKDIQTLRSAAPAYDCAAGLLLRVYADIPSLEFCRVYGKRVVRSTSYDFILHHTAVGNHNASFILLSALEDKLLFVYIMVSG